MTKQPLSLICAFARNRVIGKGNDLPWHIPNDLKHFRDTTREKPVIMGRLTYDSIISRNGKPLPNRTHYIVTRQNLDNLPNGVFACPSLPSAIDSARADNPDKEIFIIGGANIYAQSIALVDKMFLTTIDMDIEGGDAFFPDYNQNDWIETARQDFKDETPPYSFLTLIRK